MSTPENYKEHDYNLRSRGTGFGSPNQRTPVIEDGEEEQIKETVKRLQNQLEEVETRTRQREEQLMSELSLQCQRNEQLQEQLRHPEVVTGPVQTSSDTMNSVASATYARPIGNVKLQIFDGKTQSPIQWWTLFLQYCSLLGRPNSDIVKYFPFHISQYVADWYGTLEDRIKNNLDSLREAFFRRYRKNNIEYTLTDIKQGQSENTDDFINRVIRETRDSGVPENILVGMMAGGLRPDLAGIVMPQTPRTIQHLRSIAAVAEKTLSVTNSQPLAQLSAQVANLTQMEDRLMDALSSKLNATVQSMSTPRTSRSTHHHLGTQQTRRSSCNYCGRYCLNKESCPARFATCRFCKIKGHFENVCRKAKRQQAMSNQQRSFQR